LYLPEPCDASRKEALSCFRDFHDDEALLGKTTRRGMLNPAKFIHKMNLRKTQGLERSFGRL